MPSFEGFVETKANGQAISQVYQTPAQSLREVRHLPVITDKCCGASVSGLTSPTQRRSAVEHGLDTCRRTNSLTELANNCTDLLPYSLGGINRRRRQRRLGGEDGASCQLWAGLDKQQHRTTSCLIGVSGTLHRTETVAAGLRCRIINLACNLLTHRALCVADASCLK